MAKVFPLQHYSTNISATRLTFPSFHLMAFPCQGQANFMGNNKWVFETHWPVPKDEEVGRKEPENKVKVRRAKEQVFSTLKSKGSPVLEVRNGKQ